MFFSEKKVEISENLIWLGITALGAIIGTIIKIVLFFFKKIEFLEDEISTKCSRDEMNKHMSETSRLLTSQIEITRNLLIEHISSLKELLIKER
jgi:hypothetical protein